MTPATPPAWMPQGHSTPAGGSRTLIDALLEEQRTVGAAERFARWHDRQPNDAPCPTTPALESHYRRLLPVSRPVAGQQLAFDVDLDSCSGCKACVTACHSLNGLEDSESWRSVGLLVARPPSHAFGVRRAKSNAGPGSTAPAFQHVTTACHHCEEPACAHGCPVLAYDKDPITGIVRHLDDQCIGCSYCQMTCPYEVPRYSKRLGIVRKCDMCHGRLAAGEAPACVQSCPNEAIRISVVDLSPHRSGQKSSGSQPVEWLPDAPPPHLTRPTTRYRTARPDLSGLAPADALEARPAQAHTPLAVMLVLTQVAAGGFVAEAWARHRGVFWPFWVSLTCLGALMLGLAASSAHLGQPLRAWRAFLGWRRSWLSREILVLSGFAALAQAHVAGLFLGPAFPIPTLVTSTATAIAGLLGVFTSVKVYSRTGREFWSTGPTTLRFFGTVALTALGIETALNTPTQSGWLPLATLVMLRLTSEAVFLRHHLPLSSPALRRSAGLLLGPLSLPALARLVLCGGAMLTAFLVGSPGDSPLLAGTAALAFLASELIERSLFFRAVSPLRMPGLPA